MGARRIPGQAGLPGFEFDDRTLPSEQALTGEVLADRRRAALRAFREALGPCPEGFAPDEWAVALATLSPEAALDGKAGRTRQARQAFPGLGAPAALQAWREVSQRPHVAEFVREFRAVEALDVAAQREQVREVFHHVMQLGVAAVDLLAVDPAAAAKCGASAVAAAKALMDLDGLRAPRPGADDDGIGTTATGPRGLPAEDPHEALARKVALVAEDMQRRAGR